jgi:hypothetical protein
MMRIIEALTGLSGSRPTIFDSGQSSFIKGGGALGQLASPKNPRMISRDPHERRRRRGQPPGREVVRPQRRPHQDHDEQDKKKPDVPEADVSSLVLGNARLASLLSLSVLFGGKHWLKM